MCAFTVDKIKTSQFTVEVPASKSILNRAILLAAFTEGDTTLQCGGYGEDTVSLLSCLSALGIPAFHTQDGLLIRGTRHFQRKATLDVGSAGTAARFLPAILAFAGGEYEFHASIQMSARPMELLSILSALGIRIEYLDKQGHFPFTMHSDGVKASKAQVPTDISTQYASGLMLAAAIGETPFTVDLSGNRTEGSYLAMTASLIRAFKGGCERVNKSYRLSPIREETKYFKVEPDISGACYFYALSLLTGAEVTVEDVHFDTLQGDIRFLGLLRDKGVRLHDGEAGIVADGRRIPFYMGFDEEMVDFSDQTMTVAVLAAFASSPSILRGVSHIQWQESDRMTAIVKNLNSLGARAFPVGEDIFIEPADTQSCTIESFGDHRIAMAFALAGLKRGGVTIDDPDCCKKTFPHYFDILSTLTS